MTKKPAQYKEDGYEFLYPERAVMCVGLCLPERRHIAV